MEHCNNSFSKSRNRKPAKNDVWVRRSTRGSKDFDLYLDEASVLNANEDIVSHCDPELKQKAEGREMFESVAAFKTDNDLNDDSGSSSIAKNLEIYTKEKKRGRARKNMQPKEEMDDVTVGSKKRKNGRPRKMIHIQCEEEGDYLVDTESEKRKRSTKASQRQEEQFAIPKDIAKWEGRKAGEEIQSEEEVGDWQTSTTKKRRKKPRKSNQEEEMESGNAMAMEKKNVKIGKPMKNVKTKDKNADDMVAEWRSLFAQNIFKCINADCSETFISWASLFEHFHVCKFPEIAGFGVMLPCHACSKDFRFKPDFVKHIRLQHRDVYDLVHSLESGNTTKCFNYKCTAVVETYEDCVKHGVQCGSLIYCDKCQRSYKTRKYFSNHSCIGEKQTEAVKVDEILTPTSHVGKRRAAKRALDALHTTDSDDIVGSSSSQSKLDDDFEAQSDSNGDSAEYEEDDDDDYDGDDAMNGLMEDVPRSSANQRPIQNLAAKCTTILKGVKGVYRRRFKPWKGDIKWLLRWYRKNQSSFVFPEWTIAKDDIQVLSASEAAEYLPPWRISPPFNVVYEKCDEHACKTEFRQLKALDVLHLEGSSITTMFVGGPVSALEWCPCKGTGDQFLAVTTIGNYAQASDWSNRNSLIQIWRVPGPSSACKTVTLPMAIAVEFGSVYCMRWCPSSGVQDTDIDGEERLGILAISCGRDSIRILSVPHPSNIEHQIEGSDSNFALIKSKTVLILATRREKNAKADSSENKVTCIEWQPSEGHKKIAAGFLDGTICIWNLECKSQLLRISDESDCCDVILPFLRINAHLFCVNSLSWCPTDANFILSVSFDKSLKVFDIREKDAPAIMCLKKALFEKCAFLLRVGAICVIEDELGNNLPVGSRFLDFVYCSLAKLPYNFNDHSTSHKSSCLSISNSEWMNAIVTSCCEGEVVFRALAHESVTEKDGGKSIRLPVYHIEVSDVATSEEGIFEVDNLIRETKQCSTSDRSARDETVKDIIIERAEQLQTKLFKHKFTFVDSNFFEFRNTPGRCEVEVKSIRCWKPNEKSNFFHDAMCQVSQQLEYMNTPELNPFVPHEIDMADACPKELVVDEGHESDEDIDIS